MRAVNGAITRIGRYLWQRFLFLGWLGRAITVILLCYGLGWIASNLGAHGAGRQIWSVGVFVLSILVTVLFIRWAWGLSKKPGR